MKQVYLLTIMLNPNPWADAIKRQPQVNVLTVTRDYHRQVLAESLHWLGATDPSNYSIMLLANIT